MITYKDCPECGARKIRESVSLCEVCEISEGYEKRLESLRAELELAHKFHDVAVRERDYERRANHLLGEILAALNGDGGHTTREFGWAESAKRGLARYYELRKRADCLVMYPCDCTYPRDGQPDANCSACHGLGAITKTEMK